MRSSFHQRSFALTLALSFISACTSVAGNSAPPDLRLTPLSKQHGQSLSEQPARQFIGMQVLGDLVFLSGEPDFLAVVGGLAVAPKLFETSFLRESPEISEMWGSSRAADLFFESGEVIGDAVVPFSSAFLAMGMGELTDNARLGSFGTDLFRAQAANGILTIVMKKGIDRKRPNGGAHSYPSGHTSSAFAAAGTVYRHCGKTWGTVAFAVSGYVGLSRLQENMHYLSDVVAGAILGSYVSLKITGKRNGSRTMQFSPIVSPGSYGVSMRLNL